MLYQIIADDINEKIADLKGYRGGEMRHSKGNLFENTFSFLVRETWIKVLGGDEKRLIINSTKIPYEYEAGASGVLYSDICVPDKKNQGIGLDKFVYIDERLVMTDESKAYCDISMYKRVQSEFESLAALDPNICPVILQAESAIGGNVYKKTVCNINADQHLLSKNLVGLLKSRRRICKVIPNPTVLTLTKNRRSAKKEISERHCPVTAETVGEIIEFIQQKLGAYV